MKVNHLLHALGIQNVPPVPRSTTAGGTGKCYKKQSCIPCSPCSPEKQKGEAATPTPSEYAAARELLADIAKELKADVHMLRRLLSVDDLEDVAKGHYSRELLVEYFRVMEKDGHPITDPQWHLDHLLEQAAARASHTALRNVEWERAWKDAHGAFINHLMACRQCYAPRRRYCDQGQELRRDYLDTYQNSFTPLGGKG